MNETRTIARASVEAQDIEKFLRGLAPGQTATYIEIEEATKTNPQVHRSALATARRRLLADGIVIGTVLGIGVRRIENEGIADEVAACTQKARRIARKGIKVSSCIEIEKLSAESRTKAILHQTVLSIMAKASDRNSRDKISQHAIASEQPLKIGDIGSLFGK